MTEPTRFHTAARYYLQGRPPYAAALIRRVVQLCGLNRTHRLLDLGCGPGSLTLAFAPLVRQAVGVDPEPEMLRIARAEAARLGRSAEFIEGSSRDLGPSLGTFQAAVIGRAFHWMDRQMTLLRLDQLIEPSGAVVLFGDKHPKVPDNSWNEVFERLIDRYAEADAARASQRAPGWLSHEAVLLDSPFPYLERVTVIERRDAARADHRPCVVPFERVARADRARADELARELREVLAPFAREGMIAEVVESEALIARRMP